MRRLNYPGFQLYLITGEHDKNLEVPQDPEEASDVSATHFRSVLLRDQSLPSISNPEDSKLQSFWF